MRARNARIRDGGPGDALSVEGVDDEGETDDLSIPSGEVETVRAPSHIGMRNHDLAIMDAGLANGYMLFQEHDVVAHDAVGPFGVDERLIGGLPFRD
ncbi:hypothetical protein QE435_000067 [Rhizobium sp. SORGH_AS 787]|nr:hypothetical protein [Rhizobium sp. SORGH_AS_0787]